MWYNVIRVVWVLHILGAQAVSANEAVVSRLKKLSHNHQINRSTDTEYSDR